MPVTRIVDFFEATVRQYGDDAAVRGTRSTWSYDAVAGLVDNLYERVRHDIYPGAVVVMGAGSALEHAVTFLAVRRAGAAILPVDPAWPAARIKKIYEIVRPVLAVFSRRDGDFELTKIDSGPIRMSEFEDTAYILFTSGSTGQPKGVAVSDRALAERLNGLGQVPGVRPGDRVLAMTAHTFDISLAEYLLPLVHGAEVVCAPGDIKNSPVEFSLFATREKPDIIQATPSFWRLVDRAAAWPDLPNTALWCGGEKMTKALAAQLTKHSSSVWNLYGPTEATIWATAWPVKASARVLLGRALPGVELALRPETGSGPNALVPGSTGELVIAGQGLASGYLGSPDLTADRFSRAWGNGEHLGYFTGDLVECTPEGDIVFLCRIDDQVKVRGYRIEVGEIETAAESHPGVADCAVVAVDSGELGAALYAFVIRQPGAVFTKRQLRAELEAQLPEYMLPRKIFFVDSFPRNSAGKVDRGRLASHVGGKAQA